MLAGGELIGEEGGKKETEGQIGSRDIDAEAVFNALSEFDEIN